MTTRRRWTVDKVVVTGAQYDALWSALNLIDNEQMGHDDEYGNRLRREYGSLERLYDKLRPNV